MNNGFIKLHRKLEDWEWYTAENHVHVFLHLIMKANYKAGRWRGIEYKRGDVLTSLGKIAAETGLSVRNVRTILKHLEMTGEVTRQVTRQMTHLTISGYDTYQGRESSSDTPSDTPTDTQVTLKRHASDNKQEGQEGQEGKEVSPTKPPEGFERFWKAYPKRISRGVALTAFRKAIKIATVDEIIAGIAVSPQTTREEAQYIPAAGPWLNGQGWLDEPRPMKRVIDWSKYDR